MFFLVFYLQMREVSGVYRKKMIYLTNVLAENSDAASGVIRKRGVHSWDDINFSNFCTLGEN